MRILAVDDDPTILEITELFLESIGYTDVHLAPSAQHAIKALNATETPFDCILLDINMPGMTGIELIPLVVDHPVHHQARIVMLTALSDTQHIADAFVAGAIDYMLKPFELFDLEASIKAVEAQRMAERPIPVTALNYDQSQVVQINALIEKGATLRSDASGIVSPFAIENCIRRVPASIRENAALTMVELQSLADGRRIRGNATNDPYVSAMTTHLIERLHDSHSMLSYNGDGLFTVLTFGIGRSGSRDLETAVAEAIQATDASQFDTASGQTGYRTRIVLCGDLPTRQNPFEMLRQSRAGEQSASAVALSGLD